ncbi:MAG: MerR family transcriptional regulator [Erysipelotrichaceae bacterium]|nr:MerR family transcriptional regulator [Erysipelotrichaceae bacterium]
MKTHDVEEQLGITKQALIYYEKEGLINPIRDKNNYRQYTQNDIEILQVILLLRSFEISIDEIKLILSGKLSIRSCLGTKQNYLKNEKDKIGKIEEKIKEYTKRIKVAIGNSGIELEDDYIRFTYSNEKMEYGKNEINKKFNKHYQMLQSYMLKFNFTTPSGILNYLNGCCFSLENKN